MTVAAYIILTRKKDNPADLQLYVVGTASAQVAVSTAKAKLGPDIHVDPNAQPASEALAKMLNLRPGEVRKF